VTRYRIRRGDQITVRTIATAVATLRALVHVVYDNGKDDYFSGNLVTTATGATETFSFLNYVAKSDGYVTNAVVLVSGTVPGYGTVWCQGLIGDSPQTARAVLFQDYIFALNNPTLDHFGPRFAPMDLFTKGTAVDVAGIAVDFSTVMAVGEIQEFYDEATGSLASTIIQATPDAGIYELLLAQVHAEAAVAAATRTFILQIDTGLTQRLWTAERAEYQSATLTLTTGEYGAITWAPNGVEAVNDNGTITRTVGGSPLPLTTFTDNLIVRSLAGGAGNAGDTNAVQILVRRVA